MSSYTSRWGGVAPLYTRVGQLANGKPFYYAKGGLWAIEHDYQMLVEPTPEEYEELRVKFPDLRLREL